MVKTRRRNYANVSFNDDEAKEESATASEESGGSESGAPETEPPPVKPRRGRPRNAQPDQITASAPAPVNMVNGEPEPPPPEEDRDPDCSDILPTSSARALFSRLVELDVAASDALAVAATPSAPLGWLRPALRLLEFSCHGVPWILLAIGLLIADDPSRASAHLHLLVLLIVDLVVVAVTKLVFRRRRPKVNMDDDYLSIQSIDKNSFPSGHATRSILLLFYLSLNYFALNSILQTTLVLWASFVVISRVLIGRHHVFDVVVGCVIGGLVYVHLLPICRVPPERVAEIAALVNQRKWLMANLPECIAGLL